ncbi:glycosyl transferase [Leifsonia sp. LS1]|uniref:glycosyltransferase family 2 protein n=1 Tax=Leifsonia sp. LS1 TaxID=2828483 RepID=UPI001CFEA8B9|nr:glycosyltransferase family 2 protein [Leifsonia sp. LS1]GIT81036.1 glycosyl transferase [Leifsonia sp. LS1]
MSGFPTVGIALCTYNGARFLDEQLASILEQEPPAEQVVVADDSSRDGSLEIVRRAADGTGVPIVVLEGTGAPLGVTANFERAVSAVTQELVALSDQDDRWHDDRLAVLRERFAADPDLVLLHTDADLVDAEGRPLGRTLFESLEVQPHEFAAEESGRAFEAFLRRNLATGATVVFRRSLLDLATPFPADWVHDEWLAMIAAATGRVGVVRAATIDYRQHGANQIGVGAPTLSRKIGRVLEARGERNRTLASRFAVLADRLAALGDRVSDEQLAEARAKASFERTRAEFPANRLRRALPVLRLARTGLYERYASRGRADVLRDLLQPA